jgi:putative ABC transport system permease protein
MNWLYIAWRNLGVKKLQTALGLVLLAFGVGMVSLMMLAEKQLTDTFDRNIRDIDMVLGAKGSPLQLILANVYHVDAPTGNISLAAAEKIARHPYVAEGIPLAYGDNYEMFRIVGTTPAYVEHYGGEVAEGELWSEAFEVTIGAEVARATGLGIGDTFFSAHGLQDGTDVHTDKTFHVVGILTESRSVIDNLILCNIETIWGVHEETGTGTGTETGTEGELRSQTGGEEREITAMLLKKRNPLAILTIPNMIRDTNMQLALPAIEINRLTANFGIGLQTLRAIAILIMILSFASIFISVYDSLLARRYELALMRTMGASRGGIYLSLLLEGGLLSIGGALIGLGVSRLGIFALAQIIADKFHYDLAAVAILPSELGLAGAAILVGLVAAAIPGISVLRMDISETLAEA